MQRFINRNHALAFGAFLGSSVMLQGCDPATTAIKVQNTSDRAVRAELLDRGPGTAATVLPGTTVQLSDRNFIGSSIDVSYTDTATGKFLYAKRYRRENMEGSYAEGAITLKFPPPNGVETIELKKKPKAIIPKRLGQSPSHRP